MTNDQDGIFGGYIFWSLCLNSLQAERAEPLSAAIICLPAASKKQLTNTFYLCFILTCLIM
jgi:hypothetical protein